MYYAIFDLSSLNSTDNNVYTRMGYVYRYNKHAYYNRIGSQPKMINLFFKNVFKIDYVLHRTYYMRPLHICFTHSETAIFYLCIIISFSHFACTRYYTYFGTLCHHYILYTIILNLFMLYHSFAIYYFGFLK